MISVKISHGSGNECGGRRLNDEENQELGGKKARDIYGVLQHTHKRSNMLHCKFN